MKNSCRCAKFALTLARLGKYSLGARLLSSTKPGTAMNQDILEQDDEQMTVNYQRRDLHMQEVVDLGIALRQRSNTMTAVEYLRSQAVPSDVVERVLTQPGRRRAWSA